MVCRTAFESFTSILETVGGPREKEIGRLGCIGMAAAHVCP